MVKRSLAYIVILLFVQLLCPLPGRCADLASANSDQLEALFVQRLAKYVTWPDSMRPRPDGPVVVAATNARRLRPYFASESEGRFRLVQWPAEGFHILVVNDVPDREAAAILRRTAKQPVLTIGRGEECLQMGAVIALRRVGTHIKLEVNPRAAARAGLTISSRLLSIVRIYGGDYE